MGQVQSIVTGLQGLNITSCNGDTDASGVMREIQAILTKYFWNPREQNNTEENQLNLDNKFNQAKTLKDILNFVMQDNREDNLINLKVSTNHEDQHLYLIIFLMWTFALRPGSKDWYVGKGPCTLKWRHLSLDTENRTVTLRFPTKGFNLKSLIFQERKVFSITVQLQEAQKDAFESLKNSKKRYGDDDKLFIVPYDYFFNYLKSKNQHLTLKNFRTAAASFAFQTLLDNTPDYDNEDDKEDKKVKFLKECAKKLQKYLQHTTVRQTIEGYLDPRIIIAWCRRHGININRLPKYMRPNNVGDVNQTEEFRF